MNENSINNSDSIQFLIFGGLFALCFLWIVGGFAILLWKRKNSGIVFPKPTDPDVIFAEKFASALPGDSIPTRRKSNKCLVVIVTKTHFVITANFPFSAIVEKCGLEHLVPIDQVLKATLQDRIVDVEFTQQDNSIRKISLHLKDPEAFVNAIQSLR